MKIEYLLNYQPIFYSDANMSRLRESIRQVRDGEKKLTEHEIVNNICWFEEEFSANIDE